MVLLNKIIWQFSRTSMNHTRVKVLFLCTGNSCRSQMAEGWANALGQDILEARSAGIEAHGKNPRAIAVMQEAGIDISGQESTQLTPDMFDWADIIVTVCGHADEHCPAVSDKRKIHWPLSDPAKATGSESQILAVFRATRDEVQRRVIELIEMLMEKTKSSVGDTSSHFNRGDIL